MEFYVAARLNLGDKVSEAYKKIRDRGHEISFDWTDQKFIQPYYSHAEEAIEYSVKHINGVLDSDVFVLLNDEIGAEPNVLLGVALASYIINRKPKIYVVGDYTYRTMFNFHPAINRRRKIEEILDEVSD